MACSPVQQPITSGTESPLSCCDDDDSSGPSGPPPPPASGDFSLSDFNPADFNT